MSIIYLKVILLSFVQAVAEFLPISSSGHLILLHNFFGEDILNNTAFDVVLHGGSLLAIIIYFFKDIKNIILNSFQAIKVRNIKKDLGFYIIIAMMPAGVAGYFFEDIIENFFRSSTLVALALIFGSMIFLAAEWSYKKIKNFSSIGFVNSFFIGVFQCLALVPGISRSGITISSGMFFRLSRTEAARFSFLLAIPIMLGAFIKKIFDIGLSNTGISIFVVGFIFTFVFSLFAIKILMKILSNKVGLYPFIIYRLLLATIILICLS